jgi:hypothetical protein
MAAAVEHHPAFDILTPSRRAPTKQRRQRRTLVETTTTTYSQAQPHPREKQEASQGEIGLS